MATKSKKVSVTDLENSCEVRNDEIRIIKKIAHLIVFASEESLMGGLAKHLVDKLNTDDEFATVEIEVDEDYVMANSRDLEVIQIDAIDANSIPVTMFKVTLDLELEDVEEDE